MRFIVDAQLPFALAVLLNNNGHDAIHTKQLPNGNDTSDAEINRLSISEERVVVTKDGDFYNSFTATKEPFKLLHISTGNIDNEKLLQLIRQNLDLILIKLRESSVVEINQSYVISVQ